MDGLRSLFHRNGQPQCSGGRSLAQGTRPSDVQNPNLSEDFPEAVIREGAGEPTLRAEEVKTMQACIHIDRNEENRWGPPLVDAD